MGTGALQTLTMKGQRSQVRMSSFVILDFPTKYCKENFNYNANPTKIRVMHFAKMDPIHVHYEVRGQEVTCDFL